MGLISRVSSRTYRFIFQIKISYFISISFLTYRRPKKMGRDRDHKKKKKRRDRDRSRSRDRDRDRRSRHSKKSRHRDRDRDRSSHKKKHKKRLRESSTESSSSNTSGSLYFSRSPSPIKKEEKVVTNGENHQNGTTETKIENEPPKPIEKEFNPPKKEIEQDF